MGVIFLVTLFLIRTQYFISLVNGDSMQPGLPSGDLLIVHRTAYRNAPPQRGDIVVVRARTGLMVKRVVGLPGENVELRAGGLYINDQIMVEPYPVAPGWLSLGEGRLLEDRYAILGDNRSIAQSLSIHAVVSADHIVGKVVRSIPNRSDRHRCNGGTGFRWSPRTDVLRRSPGSDHDKPFRLKHLSRIRGVFGALPTDFGGVFSIARKPPLRDKSACAKEQSLHLAGTHLSPDAAMS
jgi:signal peptidase I